MHAQPTMAAGGPVVTVTVDQRYQPGLLLELLALLHSRAEGIAQVTGWSLPPDLAETRAQAVDVKTLIGILDRLEWQSQTSPWKSPRPRMTCDVSSRGCTTTPSSA
jgi:hypothetical protein